MSIQTHEIRLFDVYGDLDYTIDEDADEFGFIVLKREYDGDWITFTLADGNAGSNAVAKWKEGILPEFLNGE